MHLRDVDGYMALSESTIVGITLWEGFFFMNELVGMIWMSALSFFVLETSKAWPSSLEQFGRHLPFPEVATCKVVGACLWSEPVGFVGSWDTECLDSCGLEVEWVSKAIWLECDWAG